MRGIESLSVKLQRDLREFIGLLNAHSVDFVVMGGHAVAFHGYPRFTGDIDFLVRPSETNASRLVAVLKSFGFPDADVLRDGFSKPGIVLQLGAPPNRIDLLTSVSGVDFDRVWRTSVMSEIDGQPARFPAKAVLLENKRAAGRTKDLADVEELDNTPSV